MRNLGNCIYDYAHSFFGGNFYSNGLHYLKIVTDILVSLQLFQSILISYRWQNTVGQVQHFVDNND